MAARVLAGLVLAGLGLLMSPPVRAAACDDVFAQHMVAEALLAANFVAVAEKAGMQPRDINAVLKDVAERSAIDEFWITDSSGHAYLTNTGVDFTFSPDPAKQPQASAFWPLIDGRQKIVVQQPRKREIDDQVFKYAGVAGVDKPRIVQIGVSAKNLPACN
jgi:hypothetical protein